MDVGHDTIDKDTGSKPVMPGTVLQQDWDAARGHHAQGLWSAWAKDLRHRTVSRGHFVAEEAPG
ncbi:hypothetical protein ACF08E_10255 [Streptomyces globisporus]|uniref:hypothetical protein n=1 Tax=Streptomyces globisporus TaxID=1908 RepID=UPI0036FC83FD